MWKHLFKPRRIYLDLAAATPLWGGIKKVMAPFESVDFGNASSLHAEGRAAKRAVSDAREKVARILKSREDEVFFTSGGTEGNNTAIQGLIQAVLRSGRKIDDCEVLTTGAEHPSILELIPVLRSWGVVVKQIPVDSEGLIKMHEFERLLSEKTVLVSIAYAGSELGVVQDVKKMTHIVRLHRKAHKTAFPYVHIDACQAPLYLPLAVDSLGVDIMVVDAGKFHGPKGVGILYKKHGVPMDPLLYGGGQEGGLRSGTENTALIVGCAEALRIAQADRVVRAERTQELRDYAFEKLCASIDGIVVNGSRESRLPSNINISIPGIDGNFAVVVLDTKGIAVSTKSACSGASGSGSKAVYALGGDDARALSTIRATLGETTTRAELDRFVTELKRHVDKTRADMARLKTS